MKKLSPAEINEVFDQECAKWLDEYPWMKFKQCFKPIHNNSYISKDSIRADIQTQAVSQIILTKYKWEDTLKKLRGEKRWQRYLK